ncbi:cation diffusion facilitator family transporter [Candidatus Hydrogenedentota bacterium]
MTPTNCENNATLNKCSQCATRVILWSIAGNMFLSFVKLLSGALCHSSGLMADGIQSFSCVIGCVVIFCSLRISRKERDEGFPYGYGKVEFIVALVVFSILFSLGIVMCASSILLILRRETSQPGIIALPVALLSVALNFQMYKYSLCAGKKLESAGMTANAYQNKADMISSYGVCAGIILSQFGDGFAIFDLLAAFFVGVIVIKDAFHHWVINMRVLLDTAPESDYLEKIGDIVSEVVPDQPVGSIRIRRTGRRFWLGIGIHLPDNDNIEKMDASTSEIRSLLHSRMNWIDTVDFFLDPSI